MSMDEDDAPTISPAEVSEPVQVDPSDATAMSVDGAQAEVSPKFLCCVVARTCVFKNQVSPCLLSAGCRAVCNRNAN